MFHFCSTFRSFHWIPHYSNWKSEDWALQIWAAPHGVVLLELLRAPATPTTTKHTEPNLHSPTQNTPNCQILPNLVGQQNIFFTEGNLSSVLTLLILCLIKYLRCLAFTTFNFTADHPMPGCEAYDRSCTSARLCILAESKKGKYETLKNLRFNFYAHERGAVHDANVPRNFYLPPSICLPHLLSSTPALYSQQFDF